MLSAAAKVRIADRLAGLATHSYIGTDLWEAYELVRISR